MQRKVKVKLDTPKMEVFGAFITHCKSRQWFGSDFMEIGDHGVCKVCDKPLMVVLANGKMYYLGESLFKY